MLKIIIHYNSIYSLRNGINEKDNKTFTSLGWISNIINTKKDDKIDIRDDYQTNMEKIGSLYPNYRYVDISKDTVLGVLARLMGDVRRLSVINMEKNHIINQIKNGVSFNDKKIDFQNEIMTLTTPLKDNQSHGGGIIANKYKDFPLFKDSNFTRIIYSAFNIGSVEEYIDFTTQLEKNGINSIKKYRGDVNFMNFLILLTDETKKIKGGKNIDLENGSLMKLYNFLKLKGISNSVSNNYTLPGLAIYSIIYQMQKENLFEKELKMLLGKKNNISGIVPTNGNVTIKDIYNSIGSKKQSNNSPYMLNKIRESLFVSNENGKKRIPKCRLGVTKYTGELTINISINQDLENKVKEYIEVANVSTFQLGKKGLAYVKEII